MGLREDLQRERDGMRMSEVTHMYMATLLRDSSHTLNCQKWALSVFKSLGTGISLSIPEDLRPSRIGLLLLASWLVLSLWTWPSSLCAEMSKLNIKTGFKQQESLSPSCEWTQETAS